ncbi:hypothetical protein C8R46DRAFT_1232423 [Mycena filopes]|nr:hypothetical protein C8R46DRAFT_1232423 [Mycena filopes]
MPVDDDDPHSLHWQGLGGDCRLAVPANTLALIDDVSYLDVNIAFDALGRYPILEPATTADWYRHTEPFRGYIPVGPEPGRAAEWFQSMSTRTPSERTESGTWRIPQEHAGVMESCLISFRDALDAVADHPKYDLYIFGPTVLDLEDVGQEFSTSQQLQVFGAKAKRCVLEIWAHLAWWISAVPGWDVGVPEEVVDRILGWNLLSRPKRGFLVSLTRDWKEINFTRLISVGVPLYYVWGIFEDADPRFLPLSPRLISGYQRACTEARVRSLWGDEIPGLKSDFGKCMKYDSFLQEIPDRKDHPCEGAPRWTEQSGRINYEVKDFDSWKRRVLADDEDWHTLDTLYHHVIVEDRSKQVTTVVFLRFHRKPLRPTLTELGDFMDEDVALAEPDASEFRERFKGRCAPREGQIFDKETGVERVKPLDKQNEVAVQRFKREQHLVPVSSKGSASSLRGLGFDANPFPDTTLMGRSLGPRSTGPGSDHSSERRVGDSRRPMAYHSGWVQSMASVTPMFIICISIPFLT